MSKLSIIGAGMLGGQAAYIAASSGICDEIALIDVVEGLAAGKALDILEAMPLSGTSTKVKGSTDYALCKDSDVIIITAGIARKPGMTREDLLKTNASIMSSIIPHIKTQAPQSVLIIVSNPVDAMVYLAHRISGFDKRKVIGMAGVLDTARFKAFVAEALQRDASDIDAMVLGSHGDLMVPIIGSCTVGRKELTSLMGKEDISKIVERTRKSGEEIVSLLKTGSAFFAPAASAVRMAEYILNDRKRALPCLAYLEGEYDVHGLFVGVPTVLGKDGVEGIIQLKLTADDEAMFRASVQHIRKVVESLNNLI